MKERPILFSGAMVRALLDGRKTQTRRVVKTPPNTANIRSNHAQENLWVCERPSDGLCTDIVCPYGQPGDWLWVRETWRTYKSLDSVKPSRIQQGSGIEYKSGGTNVSGSERLMGMGIWRPSIFMPRWASRLTLEITGVRVERLQEISETDAKAEGADTAKEDHIPIYSHRMGFEILWDSLHAKSSAAAIRGEQHPWESNPWVWIIEFKRVLNYG